MFCVSMCIWICWRFFVILNKYMIIAKLSYWFNCFVISITGKILKKEAINNGIREVVTELMDRVMDRVLITDPFIKEKHHSSKPLYAALVPDEIFKGSHFERRFVTPFGGVWEKLAYVVSKEYHGHCETGYTVTGEVGTERLRRIQEVLNKLEHKQKGKTKEVPNWDEELSYILKGKGKPVPTSVVCDVY